MDDILITGAGIVSAIGLGKEETLQALREERSGIRELRYLKTTHREFPVGEVQMSNEEMCAALGIDPATTPTTRTALMGSLALREALEEAGLKGEELRGVDLVSGTTVGGMDKSEQFYLDFLEGDKHKEYISTHDCGACTEMMAEPSGAFRSMTTLSTACSSAANAVIVGAEMIRAGKAECVVAGGSECITMFHLNGFNSLMILDREPCRPFDESRAGLNLGEGAGWVVIESAAHAKARGAKVLATLAGYGNACDAFHQTATSEDGEGPYLAMQKALASARLEPKDIDYINAHGTATGNNDISESRAIRRLFGEEVPPTSSTKAFTGHTTSASGTIEAVICILALQYGFLPVNLRFREAGECIEPVVCSEPKRPLRYILSNAFGFGGNDSALVLGHPDTYREEPREEKGERKRRPIYIVSAKQISAQKPLCEDWIEQPEKMEGGLVRSQEAEYRQYIPPIEARRMGKILKRAVATAKAAVEEGGLGVPQAIITGTGLGCIENTEIFLDALCKEGEDQSMPTRFMQSTHNTMSSLVAIHLKAHGYNATYAHNSISFQSALQDAVTQMENGDIDNALVCAHDEMTPSYYNLLKRSGYLGGEGSTAGECAVSMLIAAGEKPEGARGEVVAVRTVYNPTLDEQRSLLSQLLEENEIDDYIVMTGENGNSEHDKPYAELYDSLFGKREKMRYKHLFGESYTAPALGLYAAWVQIKDKPIVLWHSDRYTSFIIIKKC